MLPAGRLRPDRLGALRAPRAAAVARRAPRARRHARSASSTSRRPPKSPDRRAPRSACSPASCARRPALQVLHSYEGPAGRSRRPARLRSRSSLRRNRGLIARCAAHYSHPDRLGLTAMRAFPYRPAVGRATAWLSADRRGAFGQDAAARNPGRRHDARGARARGRDDSRDQHHGRQRLRPERSRRGQGALSLGQQASTSARGRA